MVMASTPSNSGLSCPEITGDEEATGGAEATDGAEATGWAEITLGAEIIGGAETTGCVASLEIDEYGGAAVVGISAEVSGDTS